MAYKFPDKIFPSTLNKYLVCPFRFKCHNDSEVKAKFIETPESFIGKLIHEVLKDFFDIKKVPIEERREKDIGAMIRYLWARMPKGRFDKEYWTKDERLKLFGSEDQEKAFGLNTITILKNYISSADLSVIPLSLEEWMDCNIGEFTIAGKIDRIDQDADDSISVWDYKTGKLPYSNDIDKIIQKDFQIPIYALIASELNPFAEKIRAGLIYIKHSRVYDKTWTKEGLTEVRDKMINELKKIKQDNELFPVVNNLCPWCEYLSVCPKKDEVELNSNNKVDEVDW